MADDYYSALRIPKTASAADVKKAYLQMARDTHPDRFKDPEEKKEADARFQKITEAYNQLRGGRSRQEYDRDLAKEKRSPEQEADLFFKNGELREQSRDYETALKYYYEAMRLQPKKLEYVMAAGRLFVMDKSKTRQAADLFTRAMEIDPESPEPHLELGDVYLRTGMTVRAKRVFATALEKFPNHPELKRRMMKLKAK